MRFELIHSIESQSLVWIGLEKALNERFGWLGDHALLLADLWPVDVALEDVLEDFLDFHASERRNPDHDFVGNDSEGPDVSRRMVQLALNNLWRDVIRRSKELVHIFLRLLTGSQHEGQVEVREFQESMLVDYYIFLHSKKGTGFRSRWIIPIEWSCSRARIRFARYTLALSSLK